MMKIEDREPTQEETEPCPKCGEGIKEEEHYCPYQFDVNNNGQLWCHCCADCRQQCCEDI